MKSIIIYEIYFSLDDFSLITGTLFANRAAQFRTIRNIFNLSTKIKEKTCLESKVCGANLYFQNTAIRVFCD